MYNLKGNRKSRRYLSKILRNISKEKLNCLVRKPSSFVKYLSQFGIALTFSNSAMANPDGGVVVEGNATINNPTDTYMRVNQSSQKAIINWQDFSIDAGDHTHFAQPNTSAITLNRVVTSIPSEIYGKMTATGQVMLINQNGILFGAGAQVDVSGLVASTSDISNSDFMSDDFDFNQSGNTDAAITNEGNIKINNSGIAAFVAPNVTNNGIISAHLGKITLATGDKWVLDMGGEVKLAIEDQVAGYLVQAGHLSANGGKIMLTANVVEDLVHSTINMSGTVEATSVGIQNGSIVLSANQGDVLVSGDLNVSGTQAGQTGGEITVLGEQVGVYGNADINADGDSGGGTILIGGDYQGGGDTPTATNAFVGSDVTITANAQTDGHGGKVIVWADDTTQFHGTIEAKGGNQSGDGGLVETSGKKTLALNGTVDASSINGDAGSWLLDPNNITVQDAGPDANVTASPNFTTTADSAIVTTASIESALDGGTDVTLTTSAGGAQDGDITVNNDIEKTAGGDATLTLNAHNTIKIQSGADITSTSNKLNLTLNADSDNSGAGAILIDSGSVITSNGGNIYLGGGSDVLNDGAVGTATDVEGVELNNAQLISGAGNISIRGTGLSDTTASRHGVSSHSDSVIQSTSGTITINGTGGNRSGTSFGVYIEGANAKVTSETGNISVTGTAGSYDADTFQYNHGLYVKNATISSTGTASNAATISLNGTGADSTVNFNDNYGVYINGATASVNSVYGNISITGDVPSSEGHAIAVRAGADITSTGIGANAATITLNGSASGVRSDSSGIHVKDSYINSVDGDILLDSTSNLGADVRYSSNIYVRNSSLISTGTGVNAATITLNSATTGGNKYNYGVYFRDATVTSTDGDISLTGLQTSNSGRYNRAIYLRADNTITSNGTSSNAASITLNGTLLVSGIGYNYGIVMWSSSNIQSIYGDIVLNGVAGNGDGSRNYNYGIGIWSSSISSSGIGENAATITLNGTGGDNGDSNYGVVLSGASTSIDSVDGDISITGTAGSGDDWNMGVRVISGADITSTGTGVNAATITINGTGGDGSDDYNHGVFIDDAGTTVTSIDGAISMTGNGGGDVAAAKYSSVKNYGIQINDNASISSTGTGAYAATISLNGTGGSGSYANNGVQFGVRNGSTGAGSLASVDGNITIQGTGGSDFVNSAYQRGVVFTGETSITSTGKGDNAATITITGNAVDGRGASGVYAGRFNSQKMVLSSVDGDISITGGPTSSSSFSNKYVSGTLLYGDLTISSTGTGANAATITLNGTGANGDEYNYGMKISDVDITSFDGDISITGQGGSSLISSGSEGNKGLVVRSGSNILSYGTGADAATITLNGTAAGNDDWSYGIWVNASTIESIEGDISLTGIGVGDDRGNYGLVLSNNAQINSTGTGVTAATITLNGTGGDGDGYNYGVWLNNADVNSVDGGIKVNGTGTESAVDNYSVYMQSGSSISSTGSADIAITGSRNTLKTSTGANTIGSGTMTGNITINTDDFDLADISVQTAGNTTIGSDTASTSIGVGTGTAGTLQISDADIALFNTGSFTFGNSSGSGKMTVKGDTWADDITLQSGTGEIALLGAQVLGANDFTVNGGSLTGGQDITASSIAINVNDGVDVGTLTSTGATTVDFDTDNGGSATASIGSISSGSDINIRDGTGFGNIITLSGVANAGTANASLKADTINVLDTLTANIITLDATGAVTANVSTDNVLNLSASSASLSGKINGGTGLRAALFGINTLNFTGGNSNFNFGSYKVGFDSKKISNRIQSFEKDFNNKYHDIKYSYLNLFDYDKLIIDKRSE